MAKVEDLVDFYLWMVHNDYDHTIRSRVKKRAKEYLKEKLDSLNK